MWEIKQGHVLDILKTMPAESVHVVVTSPPYWGLRDYQVAGQLGLEKTPEAYVAVMVEVFREVRRVLRKDGTLWLNLGDSYAGSAQGWGHGTQSAGEKQRTNKGSLNQSGTIESKTGFQKPVNYISSRQKNGLKPKDLCGMPWRVALAMQADGWYLRSAITLCKLNPMPESVRDRPTSATEMMFLLTRSSTYYYDQEAVRERFADSTYERIAQVTFEQQWGGSKDPQEGNRSARRAIVNLKGRLMAPQIEDRIPQAFGRNLRNWWPIVSEPSKGAHFATFGQKWIDPCLRAGTSERGCCAKCGAPWERQFERTFVGSYHNHSKNGVEYGLRQGGKGPATTYEVPKTVGWHLPCACQAETVPATVLDPFAGSGTTGIVALKLGRWFLGIELNTEYVAMARHRIGNVMPLFA